MKTSKDERQYMNMFISAQAKNKIKTKILALAAAAMVIVVCGGKKDIDVPPNLEGDSVAVGGNVGDSDSADAVGNDGGEGDTPVMIWDCGLWEFGGDTVICTFDKRIGTLTISGNGQIVLAEDDGMPWYGHRNLITDVVIDAGVTRASLFNGLKNLTSINVSPDNAHYSSHDGVLYNKKMTELLKFPEGKKGAYSIPKGVTDIGLWAFNDCVGPMSVTIPEGVNNIDNFTFRGCSGMTSITIPSSLTSLEESILHSEVRLTGLTSINVAPNNPNYCSVDGVLFNKDTTKLLLFPRAKRGAYTIPASVDSIYFLAFHDCTNLTAINAAPNLSESAEYATEDGVLFNRDKTQLLQFPQGRRGAYTIPDGVTNIAGRSFFGCAGLTAITIPNGVTRIGWGAFDGCSGLTSVNIPEGVTRIVSQTFQDCAGLKSVTIPASVDSIETRDAFFGCVGLTSIDVAEGNPVYRSIDGVLFNRDGTRMIKFPKGRKGDYTIPSSMTEFDGGAFYQYASYGSSGLTSINAPPDNPMFSSIDGVLFSKDSATLIQYPAGRKGAYTVPDGTAAIAINAFSFCVGLTSLTIPASVTSIGDGFSGCTEIRSVISLNPVPIKVNYDAFVEYFTNENYTGINTDIACLYVPKGSIDAYRAADGWKSFGCIKDIALAPKR